MIMSGGILFLLLFISAPAHGQQTFTVPSQNFPSLRSALSAAAPNDIIVIQPSVVLSSSANCDLLISVPISIISNSNDVDGMPMVDCSGQGTRCLTVSGSVKVTIQGIGFKGGTAPSANDNLSDTTKPPSQMSAADRLPASTRGIVSNTATSSRSYSPSDNAGGCVGIFGGARVWMSKVVISNCVGLRGAGMAVTDSTALLSSVSFLNNFAASTPIADAVGGAMLLFNAPYSRLDSCLFLNNSVYSNFVTNAHAPALAIIVSDYVSITNVTANSNSGLGLRPSSVYSGAMVVYTSRYMTLSGFYANSNSVLSSTSGEVIGGDIFCNQCSYSNFSDVSVSNSRYAATSVEKSIIAGGLVFRYSYNLQFSKFQIRGVFVTGPIFVFTGGLELRGLTIFSLSQAVISNNTVMSSGIDAMYAAGVRIRSCNNVTLSNVTVANNTAVSPLSSSVFGVGMYIGSSSPVNISGLACDGNSIASAAPPSFPCTDYQMPSAVIAASVACDNVQVVNSACGSLSAKRPDQALKFYFCPWMLAPSNELGQVFMSYQLTLVQVEIYPHPECAYDSLSLFDGPSTFSPLIGRYCGSLSQNLLVCSDGLCPTAAAAAAASSGRMNMTTSSGIVTIVFSISDFSDQFFRINWTGIPRLQNPGAALYNTINIDDNINTMDQVMAPPAIVAEGAGLYITQSNVTIENSVVSRNSIVHPLYAAGAGVFVSTTANVFMNQVSLFRNWVQSITALGGSVAVAKTSTLVLSNSLIVSNSAQGDGPCILVSTMVCPNAWGGGIAVTLNSIVKVVNSTMADNVAVCSGMNGKCSARGGSISVGLGGRVSVWSSSIVTSMAMVGGGIFVVGAGSRAEVTASVCARNYCQCEDSSKCTSTIFHAGGCLAANAGNVRITSSLFRDNAVYGGGGGAIAAMGSCNLTLASSQLLNNAALEGGALYQKDTSMASIANSGFGQNNASFVGGAISASGNMLLALTNTLLKENVAIRASAIWAYGEGNISFSGVSVWSGNGSIATIVGDVQGASNTIWNCSQPDGILFAEEANEFYSQQCSPCSEGTYTVAPAISNYGYEQQCRPCPIGGSCKAPSTDVTGLKATAGFWGEANTSSGLVQFYLCPSDYCCPFGQLCAYDFCQGNRVGTLCGSCPPGMGFRFLTTSCVPNANCNDAGWVVIVIIIFSVIGCIFLLKTWGRNSAGTVAALMFFYQVAPLVKSSPWTYTTPALMSILQSVFLVSPSGSSGGLGVCIVPGMTAAQKTGSRLVVPGFVIISLFAMFGFHLLAHKSGNDKIKRMLMGPPCPVQYLSALVSFLSIAYTTFALAALEAMQCIRIGNKSVWWYNATVECYEGWQGAAIALFLLLSPLPLLVIIMLYRWKSAEILQRWQREVRCTLMDGFREKVRWWLGVSLYRRLLVVLVYSMIIDNIWKSMTMTLLCCGFLVMQVAAQPFDTTSAQKVETLCLVVLCLLSISTAPMLLQLQSGTGNEVTHEQALEWIQLMLYIAPGLTCLCIYGKWSIFALKRMYGARQGRLKVAISDINVVALRRDQVQQQQYRQEEEQLQEEEEEEEDHLVDYC